MNLRLPGYRTGALLRAGAETGVYELERLEDGVGVIAKVFELADETQRARVEHEYELVARVDHPRVAKPIELRRVGDQLVLLFERIPGVNLATHLSDKRLGVTEFLTLARSVTEALAAVHAAGIIHRDIKPSNLVVEATSGQLAIVDFGISVVLEGERARLHDPSVLEGTLPYVAPEQTGRTKRSVDFRSDLYSLGVVFYEMLCGRRPFEPNTPLELIHAHLARRPQAPIELVEGIPPLLSDLVMRLLEKSSEHRYQSAEGLAADLGRIAEALAAGRQPEFELGADDRPLALRLPDTLYGREHAHAALEHALERASATDRPQLVVIAGAPGTGKSALSGALELMVLERRGYLGVGRFDRLGTRPLQGVAEALTGLVQTLLSEPEDRLRHWRAAFGEQLDTLTEVAFELVPALASVIGEDSSDVDQDADPSAGPSEAKSRIHLTVARILEVFTTEACVALWLDDLQSADEASSDLLRTLVEDSGLGPIVFVATRLDDAETPPLEVDLPDEDVHRVELGPLTCAELHALIADTLGRADAALDELVDHVAEITEGNPLFVHQYLGSLAEAKLLRWSKQGWTWMLDELAAARIPDDVLELVGDRVARLSEAEREVLECAALVGARFDPQIVMAALERSPAEFAANLHTIEHEGLVGALDGSYQFRHERIAEVAREGIDASARARLHRAIGLAMLDAVDTIEALGDRVYEVADHLAVDGKTLGELEPAHAERFALVNLRAGQRALDSAAWKAALRWLDPAVGLFEPQLAAARRSGERGVVFEAHFARAQALALTREDEAAEAAFAELLGWELPLVDYALVLRRQMRMLGLSHRYEEALAIGRAGLERCGVRLPKDPGMGRMVAEIVRTWSQVKKLDLDTLLALPDAEDPALIAGLHILVGLKEAAVLLNPSLFVIISALATRLILRKGYHETLAEDLAQLSTSAVFTGDALRAAEICDLALELTRRRPGTALTRSHTQASSLVFVWPTARPFSTLAPQIAEFVRFSHEIGDIQTATYIASFGAGLYFESDIHLREALHACEALRRECQAHGDLDLLVLLDFYIDYARYILGDTKLELLEQIKTLDQPMIHEFASILCVSALMLAGEDEIAWALAEPIADTYERTLLTSWHIPRYAMFSAVLVARRARDGKFGLRAARKLIQKRHATVRKWASWSTENYGPMADLVEGELASLGGDDDRATSLFERSIDAAFASGLDYVAGLAAEGLAALAQRRERPLTADAALARAHAAYQRWGARVALTRLEREHPQFGAPSVATLGERSLQSTVSSTISLSQSVSTDSSSSTSAIELETVLSTLQVIGEDIELADVVERVLETSLAASGADHGALLLEQGEEMSLVATADLEACHNFVAAPIPLADAGEHLPLTAVNYVLRTGEPLVVDDVGAATRFASDPFVEAMGTRSLLCMPIVKRGQRVGGLVLENRQATSWFTTARIELLSILGRQAASSLDNATLYDTLRRTEARLRALIRDAPDDIALLDADGLVEFDNRFPDGNPRIIGVGAERFIADAHLDAYREAFSSVVRDQVVRELELELVTLDGELRWHRLRLAPVRGGEQVERVIRFAVDITDQRQAAAERAAIETKLRQQQRLESIGTLAAGVAHEINNPIQGIMGYAELIDDSIDDPATIHEFAGEIRHEAERVTAIVRNLLRFSRLESDEPQVAVDVGAIIGGTRTLLHNLLRKDHIDLRVALDPELPPVSCNSQQIQQIIMNLVTNARDALNDRYSGYDPDKRIEIRAAPCVSEGGEARVRISVQDWGGGIPEAVRVRIFEPFFTTKGTDKGTGLGLSVSYKLATEHGGTLWVECEDGVGTTFHLELPVAGR